VEINLSEINIQFRWEEREEDVFTLHYFVIVTVSFKSLSLSSCFFKQQHLRHGQQPIRLDWKRIRAEEDPLS
jgi:hypothetical protein